MTLPDALVEQAHTVFRDEYQRLFPAGGDESDHGEAVRSAVTAVLELAMAERTREIVAWLRAQRHDDKRRTLEWSHAAHAIEAEGRDHGWRCECGDLCEDHEAFCYRCGAGQPEERAA